MCGADSGVRPPQQRCERAGPCGGENEDTGQMTRGHSRNIPQCLAEPRLTGVFCPCDTFERIRRRSALFKAVDAGAAGCLPLDAKSPRECVRTLLQASRLLRQVRCQDDRGSYPRPVPELYRLAQKLLAATESLLALLEVPPSARDLKHLPCHRYTAWEHTVEFIVQQPDSAISRVGGCRPPGCRSAPEQETNMRGRGGRA